MPSDPANSVPSATALTFEELAATIPPYINYPGSSAMIYIRQGWDACQPEIDALRERARKLRAYATHKPDCNFWHCRVCDSSIHSPRERHAKIGYGDHQIDHAVCTCKLAELLAAKEDDANV